MLILKSLVSYAFRVNLGSKNLFSLIMLFLSIFIVSLFCIYGDISGNDEPTIPELLDFLDQSRLSYWDRVRTNTDFPEHVRGPALNCYQDELSNAMIEKVKLKKFYPTEQFINVYITNQLEKTCIWKTDISFLRKLIYIKPDEWEAKFGKLDHNAHYKEQLKKLEGRTLKEVPTSELLKRWIEKHPVEAAMVVLGFCVVIPIGIYKFFGG